MDTQGMKRVADGFCETVKFPQCFEILDVIKLFTAIGNINAQVEKSILS